MKRSIYHSENIIHMNTRLFNNALAGVTEEQAKERISGHNNPINWIAAHTAFSRYLMLIVLGKPAQSPYQELFENFKGYDPSIQYPSLAEIKEEWDHVTGLLNEAIESASEETLAAETQIKTPIGDFTNAGSFAFMAQHESYDIGQMAFLKKYLTKEAMSYN